MIQFRCCFITRWSKFPTQKQRNNFPMVRMVRSWSVTLVTTKGMYLIHVFVFYSLRYIAASWDDSNKMVETIDLKSSRYVRTYVNVCSKCSLLSFTHFLGIARQRETTNSSSMNATEHCIKGTYSVHLIFLFPCRMSFTNFLGIAQWIISTSDRRW